MLKKTSILGLFLFLIGFIILNQGFFMHTHQLIDGTLITHAHPYSEKSDGNSTSPTHKHSSAQFLLIKNFELATTLILLSVFLFSFKIGSSKRIFGHLIIHKEALHSKYYSGRAPPPNY